ncbi:MAG: hypothetical protein ACQETH_04145 [Candidatus Rifleibacteriota bacterium]
MKLFISLMVVFMMLGFVSAPAMACDHDCGNCPDGDTCSGPADDGEAGPSDDGDQGDDDGHGGCDGDSCHI